MIESFFILTAACAAAYLAWFFLPKIPGSGGRMFSAEEYAWLAVGLFFLPVLIFFGVLTGYFFLFWLSNPAALNFPLVVARRGAHDTHTGPRGRVLRAENTACPKNARVNRGGLLRTIPR